MKTMKMIIAMVMLVITMTGMTVGMRMNELGLDWNVEDGFHRSYYTVTEDENWPGHDKIIHVTECYSIEDIL